PAWASTARPSATSTTASCSISAARALRTPASSTKPGCSTTASNPRGSGSAPSRRCWASTTRARPTACLSSSAPPCPTSPAAAPPRRPPGALGYGDRWRAAAAVTGRTIGTINPGTAAAVAQPYPDQLGFTARVAGQPLEVPGWLIHVGANGSYVAEPADTS